MIRGSSYHRRVTLTETTAAADPDSDHSPRPVTPPALFLIVAGLLGLWAAFQLTLDKLLVAADPDVDLSCNLSVLVGCGKNLQAWQGELFGFPNPLIGVVGWSIVIAIGAAILAGGRFARWFWILFAVGVSAAMALVIFLIGQSLFELDNLCPYCMLTWIATIPTFWTGILFAFVSGAITLPAGLHRIASRAYALIPLLTIVSYAIVAVMAQIQLDWINRI